MIKLTFLKVSNMGGSLLALPASFILFTVQGGMISFQLFTTGFTLDWVDVTSYIVRKKVEVGGKDLRLLPGLSGYLKFGFFISSVSSPMGEFRDPPPQTSQ